MTRYVISQKEMYDLTILSHNLRDRPNSTSGLLASTLIKIINHLNKHNIDFLEKSTEN